ncbi:MAG: chromate transporter [Bacteroidales bacterium]|nr:chromate transporter [Bacteroidales bacterium]
MITLLLQLMWTFFLIGLFTIGGGYAMLSLIQNEVVVSHGWLTESAFTDIVAISQMTPGPIGVNCATYVGYDVVSLASGSHLMGILGSAAATFALLLPSLLIMFLIVKFYSRFSHSTLFEGVMGWLRPTVVGLIGAAAVILVMKVSWGGTPLLTAPEVSLVEENIIDWKSWVLMAAAFAASYWGKLNPIFVIFAGGVLGLLLY